MFIGNYPDLSKFIQIQPQICSIYDNTNGQIYLTFIKSSIKFKKLNEI